jgi:hypothetical protein
MQNKSQACLASHQRLSEKPLAEAAAADSFGLFDAVCEDGRTNFYLRLQVHFILANVVLFHAVSPPSFYELCPSSTFIPCRGAFETRYDMKCERIKSGAVN